MVFISKANPRDALKKIRKICYVYKWHGCYSIREGPLPNFSGAKKRKFYNDAKGQFLLCFLIIRNPPMMIGEIVGIYVTRVALTNACLGFGGPSTVFTWGKNCILGQNFRQSSQMAVASSTIWASCEWVFNGFVSVNMKLL